MRVLVMSVVQGSGLLLGLGLVFGFGSWLRVELGLGFWSWFRCREESVWCATTEEKGLGMLHVGLRLERLLTPCVWSTSLAWGFCSCAVRPQYWQYSANGSLATGMCSFEDGGDKGGEERELVLLGLSRLTGVFVLLSESS